AQLGIRNLRYVNDATPIVGETSERLYVWVPLPAKGALGPANDSIRIESPCSSNEHTPIPQPQPRTNIAMSEKTNSPDDTDIETTDDAVLDPLQEADALRTQLRETLGRFSRLVHALKRQRKQAQLVRSTLASLNLKLQIVLGEKHPRIGRRWILAANCRLPFRLGLFSTRSLHHLAHLSYWFGESIR
ncbi:MAG: hypothetical protein WCL32_22735, partial [Planctomycetota bacterium]